jgi:hypothetical protein
MASPLEDYMSELVSQHKLRETITDTDYENDLTQSQAEEAQALYAIDAQPFEMAARGYNMNPEEWAGREHEGRQRMKAAVQANYLQSRAATVRNQAQGKKKSVTDLMSTLTRLNNVSQTGLLEIDKYAPKDAGLRTQLVVDPGVGGMGSPLVHQVAKNIPDEDAVRNQELADYLQIPVGVVQKQRTKEQLAENDMTWENLSREMQLTKYDQQQELALRREARQQRTDIRAGAAEERAAHNAAWTNRMRIARSGWEWSNRPKAFVDQVLKDPEATPDMQVAASIGNAVREGRAAMREAKTENDALKRFNATVSLALQADQMFMQNLAKGKVDEKTIELAKKSVTLFQQHFTQPKSQWDVDEYDDDLAYINERDEGLSLDDLSALNLYNRGKRLRREGVQP